MGRMLEALKQPPGNGGRLADALPRPGTDEREALEIEEEVPFIEVGGPRGLITASPTVAQAPKPGALLTPAVKPVASVPVPVPATAPAPEPRGDGLPWTVQYCPWGAGPVAPGPQAPRLASELIAFHQPQHAVSDQYRVLLDGLLAHLPAPRGQVLLFTSPAPWAGTTTVMLNLAITAARQEGRRVAVVDANLRRPALAERLGLAASPGLRDVLSGAVPLTRAVQETGQAHLSALAAGATTSDTRLPFDWLLPTLRQLREQFDLVFVDAPSWNEGSEVSALAATCDAVYVVLHSKDGAGALPGLRQPPTNLQGCILTMR